MNISNLASIKLFIAMFFPILSLLGCTSNAEQNSVREPLNKPNVIIFYLDDSGYGDFSHNGNPTIATPTISKLAQQGTNFTQFYTSSPACSASRYSLLTGRVPGRSGLGSWVLGTEDGRHIHTKEITIAEGLKQNGYKTGMFGKWHLGTPNAANQMSSESLPLAHGFDEWIGTNVSHDYNKAKLLKSSKTGNNPVAGYDEIAANLFSNIAVAEQLTQIYTQNTVRFIEQNKNSPFFAYVAFNQPHLGVHTTEKFRGKSRRGLLGDVMAEIDDSVARILAAIDNAGIKNNTLIIFSSDNGPWVKFHNDTSTKYGDVRLDVGYAQPFRDGKGSNWEGGHRVPGIFYWPGVITANNIEQAPISTLDILPTIFSLTGAEIPTDRTIDGRDITSYLISTIKEPVKPFEFVYSLDENQLTATRIGPWKLVTSTYSQTNNNYGYSASIDKPLLFQVEHDLSESINRAAEQAEIVNKLSFFMNDYQISIKKEGSFWNK